MPKLSDSELSSAVRLLKKNSSINAVSSYLKRHGLVSSASSWDALLDVRIKPALSEGKLFREDILRLLRESEEYGRQHVFLFQCPKSEVTNITNEAELRKRLVKMDLDDLYTKPHIIEMPKGLQLIEVRLDQGAKGKCVVFKTVDVRRRRTLIGSETSGNTEILTYEWEQDRAINVLKIASDGLTEVRVQSHRNAIDYAQEAENIFAKCAGLIDRFDFEDFSLARTRLYMIQKRNTLTSTVRFGENTLRSKKGGEVKVSTSNWGKNMFEDDEELDGSVETFLSKGKGKSICPDVNCTWLKRPGNGGPISDIHTFIGGANNEFQVIPQCERSDYECVLEKITSFSK